LHAARNQALFRAVNEKVRAVNDGFGELAETYAVACECADSSCLQMLEVAPELYARVRESPYTFIVAAGHVYPDVECVVAAYDGHVVVEAIGADARRILAETATIRTDG
jgi:hypothetical protein